MGFFSSKKEESELAENRADDSKKAIKKELVKEMIPTPTSNVSNLKDTLKVKAKIEGGGSVIIGGVFDGDIEIDDTLFVEKGAKFSGTVKAKNVKISGEFDGVIYSSAIEVTDSGVFEGNIKSNKAFLGGSIKGIVRSIDSVEISPSGVIETQECKSKRIKVQGKVNGRVVASELLEVTNSGSINGEIITKGIRTEQGGVIIGNIQTYDATLHEVESNKQFSLDDVSSASEEIDEEIANLINIKPDDIKKYAKKDDSAIKRIPTDKKEQS